MLLESVLTVISISFYGNDILKYNYISYLLFFILINNLLFFNKLCIMSVFYIAIFIFFSELIFRELYFYIFRLNIYSVIFSSLLNFLYFNYVLIHPKTINEYFEKFKYDMYFCLICSILCFLKSYINFINIFLLHLNFALFVICVDNKKT